MAKYSGALFAKADTRCYRMFDKTGTFLAIPASFRRGMHRCAFSVTSVQGSSPYEGFACRNGQVINLAPSEFHKA